MTLKCTSNNIIWEVVTLESGALSHGKTLSDEIPG